MLVHESQEEKEYAYLVLIVNARDSLPVSVKVVNTRDEESVGGCGNCWSLEAMLRKNLV